MLDVMRKHSESFLIYLIFAAIIIVFAINFGPGSSSCSRGGDQGVGWAVMVDGEPVAGQVFSRRLGQLKEYQRRRMQATGMDITNEMFERMGLRQQVIDELIEAKLIAQEARRWGMQVSDTDLRDYIKTRYPFFEEFETRRDYENWVARAFSTTVHRFESDTRDEILAEQMLRVVTESIAVSDDELRADFTRERDRATATYVQFDPADVPVPTPTTDEIQKTLATERDAVEAQYNNEVLRYRTPKKVRARHIMKALLADASDAEVAKARGALLDLKGQIEGGADFAGLARETSDDEATKAQGGDLGLFQRGERPAALEAAAFGLEVDQMTAEPVRTNEGLHLVQVTEIVPPSRRPFSEVEAEVAVSFLEKRVANERSRRAAEELLVALRAGSSFEDLTISEADKKENPASILPVRRDTPWVLASQKSIPRIGVSEGLHAELFSLTDEAPLAGKVHEVNGSFFVIGLKERETPDLTQFEAEKDSLRNYATSAKERQVFREWVGHLKSKANIEYNQRYFPPVRKAEG
jgi:peptidyl-prolyl cis-trans isomerase D